MTPREREALFTGPLAFWSREADGRVDIQHDFQLAGGQCDAPTAAEPFGNLGASSDERGIFTVWASAGKAVRADVRLSDGTVREALHAQGRCFLWYAADSRTASPVLVGYDAAGQVVGTATLPS